MQNAKSRSKIGPFITRYHVDPSEFNKNVEAYSSFNDFFIRRLKSDARPIDPDKLGVVFPADGRHLGFQNLSEAAGVFVKGQEFDIDLLLMDAELANRYRNGTLILSRLSPVDYHRFHFPIGGVPAAVKVVKGFLFSVNPIALRRNLGYLWSNKRMVTSLESDRFGRVLLIEIGATCVGSIRQCHEPGRTVLKGQEKGWFEFGGSSTITLFERGRVLLAEDLIENTRRNRELYAKMGDRMATGV